MKKTGLLVMTLMMFIGCAYVSINNPVREGKPITDITDPSTDINDIETIHYTIGFDANLGNGDMPDVSADGGQTVVLPACTFSAPTGKKFGFWNKRSDGTDGIFYADGAAVKDLAETDGETVTLYAQWIDVDSHRITYLNTKNVNNPNVISFKESDNVVLQDLSKTGYTFDGWYSAKIYEVVEGWSAGERTTDVSLGAKWTPNTYTIIFNSNGGNGNMSNQNMTYDIEASLPANSFSNSGFIFLGWSENSADTAVKYSDGSKVVNLTQTNGAEVTLYAVWQTDMTDYDSYTVIFNANGGAGTMDNQAIKYNAAAGLNPNLFTRTGYTFQGWSASESGTKEYDDKQSITNLAAGGAMINLYAVWQPITYTIEFVKNDATGDTPNMSMTYGESKPLSANRFSREHYTFKEWNTAADGSGTSYTDGQSVSNLAADNGAHIRLYAIWQAAWYVGKSGNISCGEIVYVKTGLRQVLTESTTITCNQSEGAFPSARGSVTLGKYAIGKYPVTQELYSVVMGVNPSEFQNNTALETEESNYLLRPVEQVNWYDAITFCNKLSTLLGKQRCYKLSDGTYPEDYATRPTECNPNWDNAVCDWTADGYRLPTECEWECAARGGIYSADTPWTYTYSGSNTLGDVALYITNSSNHTWEVGLKQSNSLGLCDMSGNVWEWCWDYYNSITGSTHSTGPTESDAGFHRCLRGGSWDNASSFPFYEVSYRGYGDPWHHPFDYGIRLACSEAQ